MKYQATFTNKYGNTFSVASMDDYIVSDIDLKDFTKALSDKAVYHYITEEAMTTWSHPTPESLARDILSNSKLRWEENKELRFLLRDEGSSAIGMIGVTLTEDRTSGELWYYKTSEAPSCMYEALTYALRFLKEEGLVTLVALFELDNKKSIQILTKLGFKKEEKEGEMSISL